MPALSSAGAEPRDTSAWGGGARVHWPCSLISASACLVFSLELTDAQCTTHKVPLLFGAGLWSLGPPHRLGLQPTLSVRELGVKP